MCIPYSQEFKRRFIFLFNFLFEDKLLVYYNCIYTSMMYIYILKYFSDDIKLHSSKYTIHFSSYHFSKHLLIKKKKNYHLLICFRSFLTFVGHVKNAEMGWIIDLLTDFSVYFCVQSKQVSGDRVVRKLKIFQSTLFDKLQVKTNILRTIFCEGKVKFVMIVISMSSVIFIG